MSPLDLVLQGNREPAEDIFHRNLWNSSGFVYDFCQPPPQAPLTNSDWNSEFQYNTDNECMTLEEDISQIKARHIYFLREKPELLLSKLNQIVG